MNRILLRSILISTALWLSLNIGYQVAFLARPEALDIGVYEGLGDKAKDMVKSKIVVPRTGLTLEEGWRLLNEE